MVRYLIKMIVASMLEGLPIVFSPHAMIKLAQRGLTRDMVIRTKETSMKYTYDPMADAISIIFRKGRVAETREVADGVLLDVDSKEKPLYLEILDVRKRFGRERIGNLSLRSFLHSRKKVLRGIKVR